MNYGQPYIRNRRSHEFNLKLSYTVSFAYLAASQNEQFVPVLYRHGRLLGSSSCVKVNRLIQSPPLLLVFLKAIVLMLMGQDFDSTDIRNVATCVRRTTWLYLGCLLLAMDFQVSSARSMALRHLLLGDRRRSEHPF